MRIHSVDIAIIVAYLCIVVVSGALLARRAGKNLDSYFLGGKTIPWYLLSVSNASGMFDITGTMWMVTLLFIYGFKSVWIPWLWPSFNQIFLMVYLAVWLRRSNVLTGAEWIRTRFGKGVGAELSHLSVVLFAIVTVIGFLAYAFQGIGKFSQVFLPWDLSADTYAVLFMTITTLYVILGGMYSVVITDLVQFVILTVASFGIAVIALKRVSADQLAAVVPDGWNDLFFGWHLDLDWSSLLASVKGKMGEDGYEVFGFFFMMVLLKGILASMAGPTPNYDMQRVLATRTPRESALMSGLVSLVLYFPRYLLIGGIAVLALVFYSEDLAGMGDDVDFEQILPYVINNFVPVGLVGLLLAGLLAAFMSTFDSTVNSGAAYLVNDVFKRYLWPNGSDRSYIIASYVCSVVVVAVGIWFGFLLGSIDEILKWIVGGLYGGFIAPNLLKWHWWRLNGFGYFAGMVTGVALALGLADIYTGIDNLFWAFPIIFAGSLAASIMVSLLSPHDDAETLKQFYRQVRPWGLWRPIHEMVVAEDPEFQTDASFGRDFVNVMVGIAWHTSLAVMPICIVTRQFQTLWSAFGVFVVTSLVLKINWYDKLETE